MREEMTPVNAVSEWAWKDDTAYGVKVETTPDVKDNVN
jgi:hypothetical protein